MNARRGECASRWCGEFRQIAFWLMLLFTIHGYSLGSSLNCVQAAPAGFATEGSPAVKAAAAALSRGKSAVSQVIQPYPPLSAMLMRTVSPLRSGYERSLAMV